MKKQTNIRKKGIKTKSITKTRNTRKIKSKKNKPFKHYKKHSKKNNRGGFVQVPPPTVVNNVPYSYTINNENTTRQVRGYYSGTWKNNEPYENGTITIVNNNNVPIRRYTGNWLYGKPNGSGTMQFGNGDLYEGNFHEGRLEGEGTFTKANGEKYIGGFLNDKNNGYGEFTSANGDTYKGEWKDGSKFGIGTYTSSSRKYTGLWKDNLPSGDGQMNFLKSGVIIQGVFEYEIQNDGETIFVIKGVALYPDGSKFQGKFIDYEKIDGNVIFVPAGITNPDAGNPEFDIRDGFTNES